MRKIVVKNEDGENLTFKIKKINRAETKGDTTTFYAYNESTIEEVAQNIKNYAHDKGLLLIEDKEVGEVVSMKKSVTIAVFNGVLITLYSVARALLFVRGIKIGFVVEGLVLLLLVSIIDFTYFIKYCKD